MRDTADTAPRYRITIARPRYLEFVAVENALMEMYACGRDLATKMLDAGRVGDSRAAWSYPLDVAQATAKNLNERFTSNGGIGQPFRTSEAP